VFFEAESLCEGLTFVALLLVRLYLRALRCKNRARASVRHATCPRALSRGRRAGSTAFDNTGQLHLEEYYTLAVIGHTGIGTPHMDANTCLFKGYRVVRIIESCRSAPTATRLTARYRCDRLDLHIGYRILAPQTSNRCASWIVTLAPDHRR
jgi:hypothetical protein